MVPTSLKFSLLVFTTALFLSGCELPYYWQAAQGQWQILKQRQPITELLQSGTLTEDQHQKLETAMAARQFAVEQLQLNNSDSYLRYVELDREYVVWNVFATPELSMDSKTWCYPIAGCVSYRGYFNKGDAEDYAANLSAKGFDTYVGGVDAYSTLGWFEDAILSTFLKRDTTALSALLFHELAHQTLYVKGDTVFNESYASSVEQILLEKWLQDQPQQWQNYLQSKQRHSAFLALILKNREQRQQLFRSDASDEEKRKEKQTLIAQLKKDYNLFEQRWNGFQGYRKWVQSGLNNAQLSTVATYYDLVPGFMALYEQSQHNLEIFLQRSKELAELDPELRKQKLIQLENGGLYSK